jgi:hypothetical protein
VLSFGTRASNGGTVAIGLTRTDGTAGVIRVTTSTAPVLLAAVPIPPPQRFALNIR